MRILFDHGTPSGIAGSLSGHQVTEAIERGWDRISNGDLLNVAEAAEFDLLLTTDKRIRYQQNLAGRKIGRIYTCLIQPAGVGLEAGDGSHFGKPRSKVRDPHYAESLWRVMQHSDNPKKQALAVTCYCDDGGSEEYAVALIGGLVMNKTRFLRLDKAWREMLHQHRIQSLHMTDFLRPNGRYAGMHPEMKFALFSSVARLIRNNRIYSIVMGVPLKDFREVVSEEISKGLMRPHPMAYFMVVMQNNAIAEVEGYKERLAYLVGRGTFKNQLLDAHHWLAEWEPRSNVSEHPHVGSITFDADERVTALQAADAIVWSSHRRLSDGLIDEFAPLNKLFEPHVDIHKKVLNRHIERIIPRDGIATFASQMEQFVHENGRLPSALSETLAMNMKTKSGKRRKGKR